MQLVVLAAGLSLVSAAALPQGIFNDFNPNGAGTSQQGTSGVAGDSFAVEEIPSGLEDDFLETPRGGSPSEFDGSSPEDLDLAGSPLDSLAATGGSAGSFNPADAEDCKKQMLAELPNVSLYIPLPSQ